MSTKKSDLINKLSSYYPNFIKRDLKKVIEIFISEVRFSLKRHERIELRDVFSIEPKQETPKQTKEFLLKRSIRLTLKPQSYGQKK